MKFTVLFSFLFILSPFSSFSQFSERLYIDNSVNNINRIGFHDINMDGKDDLIVAGSSGIGWIENKSNGTDLIFGSQNVMSVDCPNYYTSYVIADMNGDGIDDVVAASLVSDKVVYFEGLENGEFILSEVVDDIGNRPSHIDVGDVDLDGDIDIIAYLESDEEIVVYKNSNSSPGNFGEPELINEPFGLQMKVGLFDADADGNLDLLTANNTGLIRCLINDGSGVFNPWTSLVIEQFSNAAFRRVELVDFDKDGDIDFLAFFDDANSPISFVENLGNGSYADGVNLAIVEDGTWALRVGDVDGDGLNDLIVQNYNARDLIWYKNNGDNLFSGPNPDFESTGEVDKFLFHDFNGNGFDDKLYTKNQKVYGAANTGMNSFMEDERLYVGAINSPQIASGDLDGDGFKDVVVASRVSNSLSWYKNMSNGMFSDQIIIEYIEDVRSVHLADLDGDGDLDVLSASIGSGVAVHENLTAGQFGTPIIIDEGQWVSTVDIDGDGDEDIMFGQTVKVAMNQGDLLFSPPIYLDFNFSTFLKAIPVDIDLDGDLDIVGGAPSDDIFSWVENEGGQAFTLHVIDDDFDSPFNVFPNDFNGDGYPDLLVSSRDGKKISRYRSNGDGSFQPEEILFVGIDYPRETLVADLDNDGDGDILTNSYSDKRIILFNNLGNGEFADWELIDNTIWPLHTLPTDIDNDGDLDLVSVQIGGGVQLYKNLLFDQGSNIIEGLVFFDENENGIKDTNEKLLQNFELNVSPDEIKSYSSANNNSNYRFFLEDGDYIISPGLEPCWELTTQPAQYEFSIANNTPPVQSFNFGVKSIGTEKKTAVTLIAAATTRCNFTVPYYLSVKNEACIILNGRFGFAAGEYADLTFSFPPPDDVSGDTLFWNYSSLYPGEFKSIYLEFSIAGVSAIGKTIEMPAVSYVTGDSGNLIFSNDYLHLSEIRCAFDPNDKQVVPARSIEGVYDKNYTLFSEKLEYTVRFQNTGNDTAFTVVIRDYLDINLDWNTFEPGVASHPYRTTVHPDGLVEFIFEDILLPDSIVNEIGSHGFVNFKIKAKPDLENYTEINNSASIYFDFNPPIFTNSISNTMVAPLPLPVIPSFSYAPDGLELNFQDETLNQPDAWMWEFGDNNTSDEQNPSHIYLEEGVYEVCLTANNSVSSDKHCEQITVNISGTFDVENLYSYKIIPNPSNGKTILNLPFHISEKSPFTVFDIA
ncbi:MAG TPA: PKD domain-containing protein, partial [Saprospiraceae bacterium]|nr:PKD domain-containing protein [Saprospiraceae bacterium]